MTSPNFLFEGMSGKQIDSLALTLIRKHQPAVLQGTKAFDIHRFVDTKLEDLIEVTPIYSSELPFEIYGLTDSANKQVIIQEELANDASSVNFFRSTLAHETGHCFIHVPQLQKINRTQIFRQAKNDDGIHLYRKDNIPVYRNPEWQAWRFAGALLMPEAPLRAMLNDGADLSDIADHFGVNFPFLKARLNALKI
jgi:Zn-dependent peptidase ImmA (M78 family)